jgi:hypothetical protein
MVHFLSDSSEPVPERSRIGCSFPQHIADQHVNEKTRRMAGFSDIYSNTESVLVAGFGLVGNFLGGFGRLDSLVFTIGFVRRFFRLGFAAAVAHLLCLGRGTGATAGLYFGLGLGLLLGVDCGQRKGKREYCREAEDFLHTLLLLVKW